MVTQQGGLWGISIYFDPSSEVNYLTGSMTKWWEARFTFTVTEPTSLTTTSTPVGTASNAPITFFIPFEGYNGLTPTEAIITDVETRGDLDLSSEYIDLRVSVSLHFTTLQADYRLKMITNISGVHFISFERSHPLLLLPHTH